MRMLIDASRYGLGALLLLAGPGAFAADMDSASIVAQDIAGKALTICQPCMLWVMAAWRRCRQQRNRRLYQDARHNESLQLMQI